MSPPASTTPLEGARLLVLGAGTRKVPLPDMPVGNGRAISVLAARHGASVACADLELELAQETVDWIEREGGTAVALQADAADRGRSETVIAEAAEALGGLDGVVINPGIGWGLGIAGTSASDWDQVLAVNVRGPALSIKAALAVLPKGGSIVLIGSVAGQIPGSGIPSYDTSKAALHGLCRAAALEAAPRGVRVNVVAPGLIDTVLGRLASIVNEGREQAKIPLGRQGTAWEVAETVAFLLSARASYTTGQVLTVDGGLTLSR